MTKKEKLQAIQELKDPSLKVARILTEAYTGPQGPKGEDGRTPVKGQDYFTLEEISLFIDEIQSQVKDGEKGEKGEKGDKGDPGKNGLTPIRGIDYWTETDKLEILNRIPKPKDGFSPNLQDVIDGSVKELNKTFNIKKLLEDPQLRMLVRGGGASFLSQLGDVYIGNQTNDQVLSWNSTQQKWVPRTVSGSGITLETNNTPNGSQSVLNLKQGTNITLVDDGLGGVTITSTASGSGDVVGPSSSVNNNVALFNGTTGKIIKDSGLQLSGTNTGDQNIFQTIAVSGQSNIVADSTTDTLTFANGANIEITTDATTDTLTIKAVPAGPGINNEFQINSGGSFSSVGTYVIDNTNGSNVTFPINKLYLYSNVPGQGQTILDASLTTGGHTAYFPDKDGTVAMLSDITNITFQTNGTNNGSQSILNLIQGTNITLTDDGFGGITIDAVGGSGSPASPVNSLQFNNAGSFGGSLLLYDEPTSYYARLKPATQLVANTNGTRILIQSGTGDGSGAGGSFLLYGGDGGATGNGGSFGLSGGNAGGGNGDGGNVEISPGSKSGSGTPGKFLVNDPVSFWQAELRFSSLTANRIFDYPDYSGTLALQVSPYDLEITDNTKGLVLKSPDGTRWRIGITNAGELTATSL